MRVFLLRLAELFQASHLEFPRLEISSVPSNWHEVGHHSEADRLEDFIWSTPQNGKPSWFRATKTPPHLSYSLDADRPITSGTACGTSTGPYTEGRYTSLINTASGVTLSGGLESFKRDISKVVRTQIISTPQPTPATSCQGYTHKYPRR